jgi:DNA invertase Pin-like site-specific DNA recombinase
MTYFIRAYLRASTNEQDAQRARGSLDRFAHEHNVVVTTPNYEALLFPDEPMANS